MRFLKLTLAYDGTHYVGWQVQPNGHSIQAAVESAWRAVTGENIRITASGRTDAGVHALGQVCSLSTASELPVEVLLKALNANLPANIRLLGAEARPTNFHAIRDAIAKTYRYQIQHGPLPDLFQRDYCWFIHQTLDVESMRAAADYLVGQHDFASFQATGSQRESTVRNVQTLCVRQRSVDRFEFVEIEITADGFLYNMVRNIVGTLVQVGLRKQSPDWVLTVLEAQDRGAAGVTAPARGLFLVSVRYDERVADVERG